jgi:hypothetical protein
VLAAPTIAAVSEVIDTEQEDDVGHARLRRHLAVRAAEALSPWPWSRWPPPMP